MLAIDQPYALLLAFSALISAVLTVSILRHRPSLGARSFSILMAAVSLWAFVALFEVCSRDPQTKIFSYKIKYLFIVAAPLAWLIFSLYYSNRIRKLKKRWLALLLVIPAFTLIMVASNGSHHLMFRRFDIVQIGRQMLVYPRFGPAFWVHTGFSYLALLAGFIFLTKHLIDYPAPYRRQVASLMIGGMAPWISNIFSIFKIGDLTYFDLTPVAFTISGIAFMWGIVRYKLLDIVPIARDVVLQNMHDGVIVADHDDNIIDINQTARRLSGIGCAPFIGAKAECIIPWWGRFKPYLSSGTGGPLPILELKVEGRQHLLQLTSSPILVGKKSLGHVVTLHDVTAAQTAQRALLESEARFKSLSENAPVIIFSLDVNGVFNYVNPAWENLLGYNRQQIMGRPFADFVRRESDFEVTEVFRQLIEGRSSVADLNIKIVHKDGSQRLFNTSASTNSDIEGRVTGIIGLAKDVTEEHRLQQQLFESQKMEAIGTLAGGIAHDFNNLLMGMQANLSLMRLETANAPSLREKFRRIEDQIQNGASLTRQLLGYARKGKYALTVFDLNVLIEEALTVVNRTHKGVIIHRQLADQPAYLRADQGQIELVLLNLFINAVDAMPDGGELTVTSKVAKMPQTSNDVINLKHSGYFLELAIRDTGIGMDRQTQDRIFEPFFTTKEMGRGTGLGLASVYGVIKNHGGSIQVQSAPGKGSTFLLKLPAAQNPAPRSTFDQKRAQLPAGGGTVLLVDDEPLILKYCHEMISSLGFTVLSTQDSEEAIHIYRNHFQEIDVVILDMVMPKMSGLKLLEILKTIHPEIRVIITTGYAMDKRITNLVACDRHQCLKKPFTSDQLASTLANLMSHKSESAARVNSASI